MLPEWVGWATLTGLVITFGWLTWWLLLSPTQTSRVRLDAQRSRRVRWIMSLLVVVSGVLFSSGARWDELWHRTYGGFGDDFLWPPHMLIYGGLALNAAFAGWGLAVALRARGGLRERFRREPLIGLLGLIAAYQVASIPSDLVWHVIIGRDITAWSLPHVLLAVTTSAVWLTGIGLALSATRLPTGWRVSRWPGRNTLVASALAGLGALALLQIGVTEWEWPEAGSNPAVAQRPEWAYAVVVLAVGVATSHVALYATRWTGAATCAALVALVGQIATIGADRLGGTGGPMLASYALILPPAIVLDAFVAWRRSSVIATLVYVATFLVTFAAMQSLQLLPPDQPGLSLEAALIGFVVALVIGPICARIGRWLREPAHSETARPNVSVSRRLRVSAP